MSSHLRVVRLEDPIDEPESELVERSRSGDRDAFARLYARYRRAVFAVCMAQLRDPVLAEDVVQDTFERALACFDRFDTGRRVLPWLLTIAVNRCISLRRGERVQPIDPTADSPLDRPTGDATVDIVLREQDRLELERALSMLPPRQRRALLLYALEGWNYAEIASAEGTSLLSVKSLIFRARAQLRAVCQVGVGSFALAPLRWFRKRAGAARLRTRMPAWTTGAEAALATGMPSVSVGLFALMLALTGAPAAPPGDVPARAGAPHAAVAAADVRGEPTPQTGRAAQEGARVSLADLPGRLSDEVLDPTGDSTPENTQFDSIEPSPSYEDDHTVYASGTSPCVHGSCPVLFRSGDGGASWTKLAAKEFRGQRVILPPDYPRDDRIFAMGLTGLQVSEDGGATFGLASPMTGGVAISPAFDDGDPRILIGGTSVVEYWADTGGMKPAPIPVVSQRWSDLAFSPDYHADGLTDAVPDGVIMVGGSRPSGNGMLLESIVYRCDGAHCARTTLGAGTGTPTIRLSSRFAQDGTAYAFTGHALHASTDGGRSFKRLSLPQGVDGALHDVSAPPVTDRTPSGLVLMASADRNETHGIHRSTDGGITWQKAQVQVGTFHQGAALIVGSPTGRLFSASSTRGIACSDDGGATWTACGAEH